jgi:hypothetical protein
MNKLVLFAFVALAPSIAHGQQRQQKFYDASGPSELSNARGGHTYPSKKKSAKSASFRSPTVTEPSVAITARNRVRPSDTHQLPPCQRLFTRR